MNCWQCGPVAVNTHQVGAWDNTGNLASSDDVDQIWWWLDEVPVEGLLGGERGAVGLPYDARVVSAAALVEPLGAA
jgi:hypothetical protein